MFGHSQVSEEAASASYHHLSTATVRRGRRWASCPKLDEIYGLGINSIRRDDGGRGPIHFSRKLTGFF